MGRIVGKHLSQRELQEAERLINTGKILTAKDLHERTGIGRSTCERLMREAEREKVAEAKPIDFPPFVEDGDDEEPIEDILSRLDKSFDRRMKAVGERKWFPIQIPETKPYGILWFGDPHLDDGGCNMPLLRRHLEVAKQPGVYGANIGDTLNNWPWTGRLARLWAEVDISNKTARRLAEWFMFDAGVRWLVWLLGNHDEWNGGSEFYKRLGAHHVPVLDWRAQFVLRHRGGTDVRVDASHGRKGSSIYNPSHGTLRAARFGEDADLLVTGHIHTYKLDHFEDADRRRISWLLQCRGYKFDDHHALVNGFAEYQHGASILAVIDPATGAIQCFGDPEEGAEYLRFKRK